MSSSTSLSLLRLAFPPNDPTAKPKASTENPMPQDEEVDMDKQLIPETPKTETLTIATPSAPARPPPRRPHIPAQQKAAANKGALIKREAEADRKAREQVEEQKKCWEEGKAAREARRARNAEIARLVKARVASEEAEWGS